MLLLTAISGICDEGTGVAKVLSAIGVLVTILKWSIPVLLIIWGTLDLGKAVMEQKPDDIQKAYGTLVKRAVAALLVFIFPSIVIFLVQAFQDTDTIGDSHKSTAGTCIQLVLGGNPFDQ